MSNKPFIPQLPSRHASKREWFNALQPRLALAEWAINHSNATAKLEASDVSKTYFDNCPDPFSDLKAIANDEIGALDLAIAAEQLAALARNRAEYDRIGGALAA